MSIRKKMIIFASVIVIIPMLIVLFLSNVVVNNQIEKAAQSYLQNAFVIGNNLMKNRLDEMKRLSLKTTSSGKFIKAMEQKDTGSLNKSLKDIRNVYDYINYYMIYDENKRLITSSPDIKNPYFERINTLIGKADKTHSAVISQEVFDLNDLFNPDTAEYKKYEVLLSINKSSKNKAGNKYLKKCLTLLDITPVYNNGKESGFLVIGSILNNDNYFPDIYSKGVENSYMAISVDGIRISSSIRSPKREDYIGSSIPVAIATLYKDKNVYFGKENFGDEIHYFMDRTLFNCDGKSVGAIGVGIPQEKFSSIMDTQSHIIVLVTIIFLVIMLFLSRFVALRITEPISKAIELTNQVSAGNNEIIIDDRFLEAENDEITMLMRSLSDMAKNLKNSEEKRVTYLKKLKEERSEQQRLSKQLMLLNETLEEKVEFRTRDLKEAVDTLKKSGEIKSRFLANMSHELRTPLTAIINCSEILRDGIFGPLSEKQQRYINNILVGGNHLLRLINNVLDISKIEAGKMTLALGKYSVSEIVDESLSIVKSLAYRKNIEISKNIVPDDFQIKADANKLKQILCNLLSNAIKFTNNDGKVSVSAVKKGESMELIVEDNGIGIKDEDQERIFNEFEQVDNSYEREYEGTGLGLALTKKLVELHGGTIYLISQIDKGTKVIINLPVDIDKKTKNKK